MATFPARAHVLERVLRAVSPQVDEIHLVLNEYEAVPAFLAALGNVRPILPDEDLKDVGKFAAPEPAPDDLVFLMDDDLHYAPDYCDRLVSEAEAIGLDGAVFGLHASLYRRVDAGGWSRRRFHYRRGLRRSVVVDQLGTGTVLTLGRHLPPLEYMRGSQMFVDVRFAKWCHEKGLDRIALARPFGLVRALRPGGETIYRNLTVNSPPHVLEEIRAFSGRSPKVGTRVGRRLGVVEVLAGALRRRASP